MIYELINYMKHLKENSPQVIEAGLEPSKGLHIFVDLDEKGNAKNFPGKKGKDWDYYDGSNSSSFLKKAILREQKSQRIGITMNKVFDKKKQIVSCSPFILSFKKDKLDGKMIHKKDFQKIINLLDYYFEKGSEECNIKSNKNQDIIKLINRFHKFIEKKLVDVIKIPEFIEMKKDYYLTVYLNNATKSQYEKAHDAYLKKNLFNKNDFNSDKEISDDTFGLSGFFNGLNSKKPFLEHKTAPMYRGIAGRIKANDTLYLNDFENLLRRRIFPSPLPIFIDKDEFSNSDQILSIFQEDRKLSYSQILSMLFKSNVEIVLRNYYLTFFNYKYELLDFDFVSKFRYSLEENGKYPEIRNILAIKEKDGIKPNISIKNIFKFESIVVKTIFNNSLVTIKKDEYRVKYFDEIDSNYVNGGDSVYQMILKYRKAFYDYIYKSKTQAISAYMWDEILWNSILGDLRNDTIKEGGYHSRDYSIKEKLNIWFSLYNYFTHGERRENMGSKIPELLDRMKIVANNEMENFQNDEEFSFGAGQIIYFLLNQSRSSERTHALLEPFLQKVKADQLQNAISMAINAYKHEIDFGKGRFERLSAQVLGYETDENLKKYQKYLLAGYFSVPVIYEKKKIEGKN